MKLIAGIINTYKLQNLCEIHVTFPINNPALIFHLQMRR
jgi:hypothetical protein